jgi:cytochrome P450
MVTLNIDTDLATAGTSAPVSDFDPYAEEVLDNPYPHYEALRELGPVVYLRRYGVWGVARHAEIDIVLRDNLSFCSGAGVGLANFHTEKPWRTPSLILEADVPFHAHTRKLIAGLLAPVAIKKYRSAFETEAELLIERVLLQKGRFDAVESLCVAYPLKVFADAVGLPPAGREHLLPYGDMVFNGFGPINERFTNRLKSAQQSIAWIDEICKRENLSPDGLGAQIYAAADRGEITHDEARLLTRTLLSAGLDTTVYTLCNAIVCFADFPDQWALVHADPALARQALEEVLRFASTFHSFYRTTTKDLELGGVRIRKGQKICVFIGSANRDPRRWERADTFDVTRRANGNLAFGSGLHACAGQMMARLEGEIFLRALAKRVRAVRPEGPPIVHYNNSVRGYDELPISLLEA